MKYYLQYIFPVIHRHFPVQNNKHLNRMLITFEIGVTSHTKALPLSYLLTILKPAREQFCFDFYRKEEGQYTSNVVGLDLGLKYFIKDQNDNAVIYPQFLKKSERRLKKAQKRLSNLSSQNQLEATSSW